MTTAVFLDDFLPMAISNTGIMTGCVGNPPIPTIAVVNSDGTVSVTPLGLPPGGASGYAIDVNDSGQVAGHYYINGENRGFRWSPGVGYEDLGTLHRKSTYARGWGIDDNGTVVGQSATSRGDEHAIAWDGAAMIDLNDLIPSGSGVDVLTEAGKINSAGQFLCTGWNGAAWQTCLLSPTP